jgi:hypothetical protein
MNTLSFTVITEGGHKAREDAIHAAGYEVMYAKDTGDYYETWQYFGDGRRSELPNFYTLCGLHDFAVREGYGIVWL